MSQNAFSILDSLLAASCLENTEPLTEVKPKPARKKTFTDEFNEIIRDGVKRTGFPKERIEAFLPSNLLPLYQAVNRPLGKLPDDEKGKELLRFVKDDIFGILPDHSSPATAAQSDGFKIGGKRVAIQMKKDIASRQLTSVLNGLPSDFLLVCQSNLKDIFSPKDIKDTVLGTGYGKIDRQLVANIIRIAAEMKSEPK